MKTVTIEIGGRQLPLVFDMAAWCEIDERVGAVQDLGELLSGPGSVRIVNRVAAILARSGGAEDVTEEWILKHASPRQLGEMSMKVTEAISVGFGMEAKEGEAGGEVDVTLQEINKKKRTGRLTVRQVTSFGLIAGVSLSEIRRLAPGFLCDLYIYRRRYDDALHGIKRGGPGGRNQGKARRRR